MANLSSFFPAAASGGGLLNIVKYSTARSLSDSDYRNAASYTVNPATDLGLSDGDLLGYFMVGGGGRALHTQGAGGGRILQGTIAVTTAATNLTLTIGVGSSTANVGTDSTISGGLTLTTANGSRANGWNGGQNRGSGGPGVFGYGSGGASGAGGATGAVHHGFGSGANNWYNSQGGDGAIILMYS